MLVITILMTRTYSNLWLKVLDCFACFVRTTNTILTSLRGLLCRLGLVLPEAWAERGKLFAKIGDAVIL